MPDIDTPTFVLTAEDDCITKFKFVPLDDLRRNPNIIVGVTGTGAHCDFLMPIKDKNGRFAYYEHYAKRLAIKYLE